MLQPNMVSNPASYIMLAVCVLGIGFMVRFLIALASEENKTRVVHPFHTRGAHYADAADAAFEPPRHRWAAVDSGAHIALGVLRITAALTSNPSRTNRPIAAERSNVVMFAGPAQESDSATERRYRPS
jgi:hypothetical protein